MSEINYFKIEESLANIFRNDITLQTSDKGGGIGNDRLKIEVEESFRQEIDNIPWCGIYLDSWETSSGDELVAAGATNRFRTFLNFEVWLYEYHLEGKEACKLRDRLLQKVKEVVKKNRKISDTVLITTFQGGEFDNAKVGEGFFRGVSIRLQCEVRE